MPQSELPLSRIRTPFALVVAAQAAHSLEEYAGRLWESFPPARFLTGLVSADLELGFIAINVALVGFGIWCLVWPIGRTWPSATAFAWAWVVIELVNAIGHPLWSLRQRGYTPGLLTALVLVPASLALARRLATSTDEDRPSGGSGRWP